MNKKELSVIVPAYNAGNIIEHCLSEICRQKEDIPGSVELIVVDDASQDNTALLAEKYCDRLVVMEKNSGAASSRNSGVKEATSALIVFVDADVIISKGVLQYFWRYLKENHDISAVVGQYTERPFHMNTVSVYHNAFTSYHHDLSMDTIDWFWGALSSIRKDALIDAGGFNEKYSGASAEDLELGYDLTRKGHAIRFCPDAQGTHAHFFSLRGMCANDFKKAILGIKLKASGKFPATGPRFATYQNCITPFLFLVLLWSLIMGISGTGFFLLSGLCFLSGVLLNISFYRFLKTQFPLTKMIPVIMLHWLQVAVISTGAIAGAVAAVIEKQQFGQAGRT